LPRIRELLDERFPNKLRTDINPDEAVAYGAAINAVMVDGDREKDEVIGELLLLDVTPLSLGLETLGGVMEKMIHRNTPLPCEFKKKFTTSMDNQPSGTIKVFEGEREKTKDNNLLGQFVLHDIPPLPKGKARVEVCFSVDTDGIMSISAKELTQGNESKKIIRNEKGRLSSEHIEQMLKNAEEHKENDRIFREKIDAKISLENYISSTNKMLSNGKFSEFAGETFVTDINDTINSIYDWLDDIEDDMDMYEDTTADDFNCQYRLIEETMLPMVEKFNESIDTNDNDDN
jgi:L1 cell adhesion molecule like protein